ncbi:hypothetical protein GQ44DRAFT_712193 [Phaeosphaeriaceae sp. PMI808]|nr:hypothetical protein GQ44DRAFT_712193 [Phaeosphaeriaceae sp. PMI808]
MRLFLAGHQRFLKNSYVKLHPWRTTTVVLKPWERGSFKLRSDSMRELITHIDFESPWPKARRVSQGIHRPQPVHHPISGPGYHNTIQTTSNPWIYRTPVQPANLSHQSRRLYVPHEQTPLLRSTYNPVHPPVRENFVPTWVIWLLVLLFFALVVGVWYYIMQ